MEFLEYKSNAWGQRVLDGVLWDLIWPFVSAGFAIIVIHAVLVVWRNKVKTSNVNDELTAEQIDE